MSKSERSALWFCRVDGEKSALEAAAKQMSHGLDVVHFLAAYHVGEKKENPHCHFVIKLSTTPQKQSFALRVKQMFKVEKKSQYALSVWDGDKESGATGYLFHEDDAPIICNKGFTTDEIDAARRANAAVQKVVAINKEKAQNKLVDKAVEVYSTKGEKPSRVEILEFMLLAIHRGENYHPGNFLLKKFVEEVELRLLAENDIYRYAENLAFQLWRN